MGVIPNQLLFEHIGMVIVPETTHFIASKQFILNYGSDVKPGVKIAQISENFKDWFLYKVEQPNKKTTLFYSKLNYSEIDDIIISKLGANTETMLAQIFYLMEQPNSENNILLRNGLANVFYVKDVNVILRAVRILWHINFGGWLIRAHSICGSGPRKWLGGGRVFFNNF